MCLIKSSRVHQLIVKQTGCLSFVQVTPKRLPFAQDMTKQFTCHEKQQWAFSDFTSDHI